MNKIITKELAEDLIEQHFHENLTAEKYEIKSIKASSLLNYARFDLAFKLLYLDMKDKHIEFSKKIYAEHIRAFSLGKFIEPGNEEKNSLNKYLEVFDTLLQDIKNNGFDISKTVIPLSTENIPLDGAHRISTAIYLKKDVNYINIDRESDIYDYKFFYDRNVSSEILDTVATKFVEYANNLHIAFLWPTAKGHYEDIKEIIPNVVYKKEIELNHNGAHNLLSQIYYGEEWLGSIENNFNGVQGKLVECFKSFDPISVIAFQAENLDEVLEMKERIREVFNVGKHSIHITDTKEEAIRTARVVFNDNSIHFLNYAKPNRYLSTHKKIDTFKKFISKNNIDFNDVILDDNIILSAYGLQESNNIDYLTMDNDKEKIEMIFNPKYHFYFNDIKFISFNQLYKIKIERAEKKDKNDTKIMEVLLEDDKFKQKVDVIKQKLYYGKVKLYSNLIIFLKKYYLYSTIRSIYRFIKGRK